MNLVADRFRPKLNPMEKPPRVRTDCARDWKLCSAPNLTRPSFLAGRRTSTNRKRSRSDAENLQELASATNNKRNKPLLGTPPEGARDSEHTEGLILLYEAIQDHPEQELDPVITSPVQSSKRPSTGNMDDTEDELTVDSGASLKKDVEVVDSGVVAKRKPSKAILEGYGGPKTLGFTPNNPAVKSRKTARTSAVSGGRVDNPPQRKI